MLVGFISNVATAVAGVVQNVATAVTVLATDTPAGIDQTLVESLISLAKSCMGLFTEFPINIILIGGLCGVAFGLIRKAKKTAR